MNKILFSLLFFFPAVLFATNAMNPVNPLLPPAPNSLSLAPPPSDVSVVFLSNIFGVLGGILHGTGSQIMGVIFGVFNSAVLAIGGIIIVYTLVVSTLNTAHEGQLLGQKFSSIWVPVRSILGLALLIPQPSGYCMMQVFVMWVVVQGVGAADQIWSAALSYLNRGGAIIQGQMNPTTSLLAGAGPGNQNNQNSIAAGAATILSGQVCMLGLQNILQNQLQQYMDSKNKSGVGPCTGKIDPSMQGFCNTDVPDFISSVNAITYQTNNSQQANFTLPMPNFPSGNLYSVLNGLCGSIKWNAVGNVLNLNQSQSSNPNSPLNIGPQVQPGGATAVIAGANIGSAAATVINKAAQWGNSIVSSYGGGVAPPPSAGGCTSLSLSSAEADTVQLSRAAAIQQMYSDLASVAQVMVNNDPQLNTSTNNNNSQTPNYSSVATRQFGVPYTNTGTPCSAYNQVGANGQAACTTWGSDTIDPNASGSAPLFSGTEFQGAVADYNGIMLPVLSLKNEAANCTNYTNSRAFIQQADAQGWMLAGSYFFNLVTLNTNAIQASQNAVDTDSNLGSSVFDSTCLTGSSCSSASNGAGAGFTGNSGNAGRIACAKGVNLCNWLTGNTSSLNQLISLINGVGLQGAGPTGLPPPVLPPNNPIPTILGEPSSTVYGYLNNGVMVSLPGQPGATPPPFVLNIALGVPQAPLSIPEQEFGCMGYVGWPLDSCVGTVIADALFNGFFLPILNVLVSLVSNFLTQLISILISIPLQGMALIFLTGVSAIEQPNTNPIVALANMGIYYINFVGDLWMKQTAASMLVGIVPGVNVVLLALASMVAPVVFAWLTIMLSVGFLTAYYVPFVPYMIFTFGTIAWLMTVIEAMVAAPIVALGITSPEGHEAFGKGEHAIMILLNVFLRPAMMIIGYIAAISLSYVVVWVINAGFANVNSFLQGNATGYTTGMPGLGGSGGGVQTGSNAAQATFNTALGGTGATQAGGGYVGWAGIFGFFFSIMMYTTLYLVTVQKSFNLITALPEKVLNWIGGHDRGTASEIAGWQKEGEGQMQQAGEKSVQAQKEMFKPEHEVEKKPLSQRTGYNLNSPNSTPGPKK